MKRWKKQFAQEKHMVLYSLFHVLGPGAHFSKVPKLLQHILGDIILFVSSKQRHLDARNFAFMLIFIPFTT